MNGDIRSIILEAQQRGASQEEISQLISEYSLKKKDSLGSELVSDQDSLEPTLDIDPESGDSDFSLLTTSLGRLVLDARKEGQDDEQIQSLIDNYRKTEADYEMAGRQQFLKSIPEEDALAIDAFVFKREENLRKYFDDNFKLENYYSGRSDFQSYASTLSDTQKEEVRQDLINSIIDTYGYGEGAMSELLKGTDEDLVDKIKFANQSARSIATGEVQGQLGPIATGILQGVSDGDFMDKATSDIREQLREDYTQDAYRKFEKDLARKNSEEFLASLPDDKKNDLGYLQAVENRLNKEYDIILDLTGDGYSYKKEGRNHVTADTYDGMMKSLSELRTSLGTILREVSGVSEEDIAEYRQIREGVIEERTEDMRTSLQTISEKFESGDFSGGFADGLVMTGESLPMMAAAIGTGLITRNARAVRSTQKAFPGVSRGTRAFAESLAETKKKRSLLSNINTMMVTSSYGAATTYNRVRDEEWYQNLSAGERFGYITTSGIAEGLPAAVGASIFNNVSASVLKSLASKEGIGAVAKGVMIRSGLGALEEGVTEGVTAAIQYTADIAAKKEGGFIDPKTGKLIEWNQDDFERSVKDGWYAGIVMGGGMALSGGATTLAVKGLTLAAASAPVLKSKVIIKQAMKEFDQAPNREARQKIGQRIIKAVKDASKIERDRQAFYEQIGEENQSDLDELVVIQNKLAGLAQENTKADSKRKKEIREEVGALLEQRKGIETKYDEAFDIDIKSERRRIFTAVTKIDKRFGGYGEIFGDQDSVTVTEGNADEVLDNIMAAGISDADTELGAGLGSVSSAEQVSRGLVNAIRAVKALAKMADPKTGKRPRIVVHRTQDSFIQGSGQAPSRGVWVGQGEIHLLAPAIKENTAYHEAFHDLALQTLGESGVTKLASSLSKSLRGPMLKKYARFLNRYIEDEGVKIGDSNIDISTSVEKNVKLAEEFLVELLADLSSESVSIEFKKGVLDSFLEFLSPVLGKFNIKIDKAMNRVKMQDVVNAINKATGQMREGEAVTGVADIAEAIDVTEEQADVEPTAKPQAIDVQKGFEEVDSLTEGTITTENPIKLFKGLAGKVDLSGQRITAHEGVFGVFSAIDREIADQYAGDQGVGESVAPAGTTIEVVEIDPSGKTVSDFRKAEVEAINASEAQIVKLVTLDGRMRAGEKRQSQYIIKDGNLIEGVKPSYEAKAQEIEWQETPRMNMKDSRIAKRNNIVQDAAFKLAKGQITNEEYRETVIENSPITRIGQFFSGASQERMETDLRGKKKDKILAPLVADGKGKLPEGTPMTRVETRLDIPAYLDNNLWVVTVHEPGRGPVSYTSAVRLENVTFETDPRLALTVASKMMPKATFARMQGDVVEIEGKDATEIARNGEKMIEDIVDNPQWTQVGMNPFRHSFFWERSTGKPVVAADEVIQVGGLVYAKNPTFESIDSEQFTVFGELVEKGEGKFAIKASDQPLLDAEGKAVKFQKMQVDAEEVIAKPQLIGAFEKKYFEDEEEFNRLKEGGFIKFVDNIYDVLEEGTDVTVHMPDNMFVGGITLDGQEIIKGEGGVYYTLNSGNVWSSSKSGANSLANILNEQQKASPDGKARLVLVRGSQAKMISSTAGVKASMRILEAMMDRGMIPRSAMRAALNETGKMMVKDKKTGKMVRKYPFDFTGTDSASAIKADIEKKFMDPTDTTFEKRGFFFADLVTNLSKFPFAKENKQEIADFLGVRQTGEGRDMAVTFSKAGVLESIGTLLTERLLLGIPSGSVYAMIEVDQPVKVVEQPTHESYTNVLQKEDGSRPILTVFNDRSTNVDELLATKTGQTVEDLGPSFRGTIGLAQRGLGEAKVRIRQEAAKAAEIEADENATPTQQAKQQDSLRKLIADFIEKGVQDPQVKIDKRRKQPVTIEEGKETGQQSLFAVKKKEIIELLMASGLSKESAELVYRDSRNYAQGRAAGKKHTVKTVVNKVKKQLKLKTTEAKNLKQELDKLKQKAKSVKEFRKQARELIQQRAKEFKVQFTASQVRQIFEIAMSANQVSAAKLAQEGDAVMDTFISRISKIFDAQNKKQAMQDYIDAIAEAKKLQDRIKKKLRATKKGKALRAKTAYLLPATRLAELNPRLMEPGQVQDYLTALKDTLEAVTELKVVKDKDGILTVKVPKRISAATVQSYTDQFAEIEEIGRDIMFTRKAERAVEKAAEQGVQTTVEEEKAKVVAKYERSQLSATTKMLEDAIDEHNRNNPNDQRSIDNPADIEATLDEMAFAEAELKRVKKETVINEGLLPLVESNLDRLLQDPDIRSILGFSDIDAFDADKLAERLSNIDTRVLIQLEYKLDSMMNNGDAYGIEYMRVYFDALDAEGRIKDFRESNPRVKAFTPKILGILPTAFMTSLENFTRQMFPQLGRAKLTKLRRALMLDTLHNKFEMAEQQIALFDRLLTEEIAAIKKDGGSVNTVADQVLMEIFSRARQVPDGRLPAQHYADLKDIVERTIDHMQEKQKGDFTEMDIAKMREAYDFLFGDTNSLDDIIDKMQDQRGDDIVRMVDFMVGIHGMNTAAFEGYVNRFLGKEMPQIDNYTHLELRRVSGNAATNEMLDIRERLIKNLTDSSVDNAKKVAGASYNRTPGSLAAKDSIMALDFIGLNMRSITESVILQNTASTVSALSKVYGSEAFSDLIADDSLKKEFKTKVANYISKDRVKGSSLFSPRLIMKGVGFRNPLLTLRAAADVRAFGGLLMQTVKQSTVLFDVLGYSFNTLQATRYISREYAALWHRSLSRDRFYKDDYIDLPEGKNDLLRQSSVFRRDYDEGLINASSGPMEYDKAKLVESRDKLRDLSLRNLKKTDKLAAVAGFFTFYGDYLINEGVVESYEDIDWGEQARLVREGDTSAMQALDYANATVSATQGPSTAREQADFFNNEKGAVGAMWAVARDILFRYQRFGMNKKAGIFASFLKATRGQDRQTKGEGAKEFMAIFAEQTAFHAINYFLIKGVYSLGASLIFGGDDEEEDLKSKNRKWYGFAGSVLQDMSPLPTVAGLEDIEKLVMNKYVLFPATTNFTEDFEALPGDTYDEKYQRWLDSGKGIPTFASSKNVTVTDYLTSFTGVYGDVLSATSGTVSNLKTMMSDTPYITTSFGTRYYIRPEDRDKVNLHLTLSMMMQIANIGGIGLKELDGMVKTLDDEAKNRGFRGDAGELEVLGYSNVLMDKLRQQGEDGLELIDKYGLEMAQKLIDNKLSKIGREGTSKDVKAAISKITKGVKRAEVESYLKDQFGDDNYSKFIQDLRNFARPGVTADDITVYMRLATKEFADQYSDKDAEVFQAMLSEYLQAYGPTRLEEVYEIKDRFPE